ncbi:unnamed protein product [Camellia sinensis]
MQICGQRRQHFIKQIGTLSGRGRDRRSSSSDILSGRGRGGTSSRRGRGRGSTSSDIPSGRGRGRGKCSFGRGISAENINGALSYGFWVHICDNEHVQNI